MVGQSWLRCLETARHSGSYGFLLRKFVSKDETYSVQLWKTRLLGLAHAPFNPLGDIKKDMVLNGITTERLADRKRLLNSMDSFRRELDNSGSMDGLDAFQSRAFDILTSSRLLNALDLSKEDPKVLARYGKEEYEKEQGDAAPRLNEQFLLARRLVEAGVRVVTLSYSFWDWHGSNFRIAKENFR